jgi:hypothetical protein
VQPSIVLEPESVVPLRRDQFVKMIEAGMFEEYERIELLEGVLVRVSPQDDPHAHMVLRITMLVTRVVGDRAGVAVQLPFNASAHSRPAALTHAARCDAGAPRAWAVPSPPWTVTT